MRLIHQHAESAERGAKAAQKNIMREKGTLG